MGNVSNIKANTLVSFFSRVRMERTTRKEKWKTVIMIIVKHPPPFEIEAVRNHLSSVPGKIRSSHRERIKPRNSSFS